MDDRSKAVHKFEVAVDRVHGATRVDVEDDEDGNDSDMKITPLQVKHMMKSFKIFDSNNDSTLDMGELAAAFRLMGQNPTKKQIQDIAKEADLDGNGRIDEQEFTRLLIKNMQSTRNVKEELKKDFAVFDTDGKGKVNKDDLMNTLKLCGDDPLTDREAEDLMEAMDINKDGFIDTNGQYRFVITRGIHDDKKEPSALEQNRRLKEIHVVVFKHRHGKGTLYQTSFNAAYSKKTILKGYFNEVTYHKQTFEYSGVHSIKILVIQQLKTNHI